MKTYNEINLLRNMSIVPIIIFILFSIIITSIIFNYHQQQLKQESILIEKNYINLHKDLIKKEVIKIYNIIKFEYKENQTVYKLPEEKIKKYILELIESIKYDKDGYIFIVDYNGNFLINIKQSLLNENQINLKDRDGRHITKQIIDTAKKGENYISYISISDTHHIQTDKTSYIKSFEPWNWAIGYGFHPSDIQSTIDEKISLIKQVQQEYLTNLIIITFTITVVLSIILLLLATNIKKIFTTYKHKIITAETKNRRKNEIIYHQAKMATIGELLNMISHQWRQPLSQINSITLDMYIEQKNGTLDEKTLKKNINDIEHTTEYLSQTIDAFSNFFVPETEVKLFLAKDAIEQCIQIIHPSIKHINLEVNYNSIHQINGYITLFQQVILSIITNCIDTFTSRNIKKPKITISTYDKNKFTYIVLSDNGGGIVQENLNTIFDLYFSTKKKKTSSGLGLYIAKKIIVEQFHGDIYVSNINYGAKFTIRVPMYDTK